MLRAGPQAIVVGGIGAMPISVDAELVTLRYDEVSRRWYATGNSSPVRALEIKRNSPRNSRATSTQR